MSEKITVRIDEELKSIVPGFLERRKGEVDSLRNALKSKDFNLLKTIGHNLKGSAGGYGFDLLGQLGAEIESASIEKDENKIEATVGKIESYLSNIDVIYGRAA